MSEKSQKRTRRSAGARRSPGKNKAAPRPARGGKSPERSESLQQALEELRVAEEELREQNQELLDARHALDAERQRYRDLFELMPDAYLVTDARSTIREANRAASELFVVGQAALIGKPLTVFIPAGQKRAFSQALVEALMGPRIWEGTLRPRGPGPARAIEFSTKPVLEHGSETPAIYWILRDITARKHEEARRRAQAEMLREQAALLNLTHETIIVRDLDGTILFWNRGAEEMYGWSAEEARGRITHEILRTRFPVPLHELNDVLLRERRWEGELVQTRKDGSEIIVASRQVLQRSADGSPRGILEINTDITSQKRDEQEIRSLNVGLERRVAERTAELEDAYSKTANILSSITDAYIAFDPEWRLVEINPAAERHLFRRPRAELLGKVFWEEYPEAKETEFYRQYQIAARTGRPTHFDGQSRIVDKWFETHAYPTEQGLRVYLRDITERKREEETRAQLVAIVESSEDAIIGLDLSGRVTSWNPGAERLFGYTAQEMRGRPISMIYPPQERDEFPSLLERLERGERIQHYETIRVSKEGKPIDVSLSISPLRDAAGELVGASKIARDISADKRVRQAEQFLGDASVALAGSLDLQVILDRVARLALPFLADYCVVDVLEEGQQRPRVAVAASDPEQEKLLRELTARYPRDPSTGPTQEVLETGQPVILPQIPANFWESAASDPQLVQLLQALRPRAYMVVPMMARGRPFGTISLGMSESGRAYDTSDLAVALDLAHRAAMAVENARLYLESQAAIVARDQFLSVASHEVKTPLTVIQGYTQLLRKEFESAGPRPDAPITFERAKLVRNLDNIEFAVARLTALVNDLLDVSRMRDHRLPIVPERVNLIALLSQVVANVRGHKDHRTHMERVRLRVEISEGQEIWGEWDPARLQQVLTNLVDNAVKYSPPGGLVTVRVGLQEGGDHQRSQAHLVIEDQGIGIPAQELRDLFRPFIRSSNAIARHYPGLGLGLAVSREIVEGHGGQIWAESAGTDQGATFHVLLPGVIENA